jgi:hypothetical protein
MACLITRVCTLALRTSGCSGKRPSEVGWKGVVACNAKHAVTAAYAHCCFAVTAVTCRYHGWLMLGYVSTSSGAMAAICSVRSPLSSWARPTVISRGRPGGGSHNWQSDPSEPHLRWPQKLVAAILHVYCTWKTNAATLDCIVQKSGLAHLSFWRLPQAAVANQPTDSQPQELGLYTQSHVLQVLCQHLC